MATMATQWIDHASNGDYVSIGQRVNRTMSGNVVSDNKVQHSGQSEPIINSRPVEAGAGRLRREERIRSARDSRAFAAKRDAIGLAGAFIIGDSLDAARLGDLLIAIRQGFAADGCTLLCHHSLGTSRLVRAIKRRTQRGHDSEAEEISVSSVASANLDNPRLLCGERMVACLRKYVRSSKGDRLLGVLSIQQRTPRKFQASDVALLDAVSDLLRASLERWFFATVGFADWRERVGAQGVQANCL